VGGVRHMVAVKLQKVGRSVKLIGKKVRQIAYSVALAHTVSPRATSFVLRV
jgi:hypothetical protein